MRQKVEIVPAAEADLPEILSLAKAAFPDPWTEQQFRQTMCCCYSRIWCARAAGEFCGYAAVSLAGDAVNLDDIAVVPAFRRQGIGRQLLDWAHRQFPETNSGWKCGSPTPPLLPCMNPQAIGRWAFGNGITAIRRRVLC